MIWQRILQQFGERLAKMRDPAIIITEGMRFCTRKKYGLHMVSSIYRVIAKRILQQLGERLAKRVILQVSPTL